MTSGRVIDLQALVNLTVMSQDRVQVQIECVLDTGFEGCLTLPSTTVQRLGLPYLTDITATLADSSATSAPVYLAIKRWLGEEREIAVIALDSRPLLGTALLEGTRLQVDFLEGGEVILEPLG